MECGILGLVDGAHAAITDLINDLILADGLAYHNIKALICLEELAVLAHQTS